MLAGVLEARVAAPGALEVVPNTDVQAPESLGFELVLPERPKGIPMDTSVQVEVEDRAGRKRRGTYTLIRWNHRE